MQDHLIIDSNYGKWYKSNNCENIWNMLFPLLSPMFSSFYFILINISSFFWLSENYFIHCVKIVQVRSYFWFVFSHTRTEYGKIPTRNNSVLGHFSRYLFWIEKTQVISSHQQHCADVLQTGALKNFAKFTRKHHCWKHCNFRKFLRTLFSWNTSGQLLPSQIFAPFLKGITLAQFETNLWCLVGLCWQ